VGTSLLSSTLGAWLRIAGPFGETKRLLEHTSSTKASPSQRLFEIEGRRVPDMPKVCLVLFNVDRSPSLAASHFSCLLARKGVRSIVVFFSLFLNLKSTKPSSRMTGDILVGSFWVMKRDNTMET